MNDTSTQSVDYLRDKLEYHISWFTSRMLRHRRLALLFRGMVILLSFLLTVLLGLKGNIIFKGFDDIFSAASLVISAAISLFAALEAFLDPRGLWVRFTKTLWSLYRIKDDLTYATITGNPVPAQLLDTLYQTLQDVLSEANATWVDRRERAAEVGQRIKAV